MKRPCSLKPVLGVFGDEQGREEGKKQTPRTEKAKRVEVKKTSISQKKQIRSGLNLPRGDSQRKPPPKHLPKKPTVTDVLNSEETFQRFPIEEFGERILGTFAKGKLKK